MQRSLSGCVRIVGRSLRSPSDPAREWMRKHSLLHMGWPLLAKSVSPDHHHMPRTLIRPSPLRTTRKVIIDDSRLRRGNSYEEAAVGTLDGRPLRRGVSEVVAATCLAGRPGLRPDRLRAVVRFGGRPGPRFAGRPGLRPRRRLLWGEATREPAAGITRYPSCISMRFRLVIRACCFFKNLFLAVCKSLRGSPSSFLLLRLIAIPPSSFRIERASTPH